MSPVNANGGTAPNLGLGPPRPRWPGYLPLALTSPRANAGFSWCSRPGHDDVFTGRDSSCFDPSSLTPRSPTQLRLRADFPEPETAQVPPHGLQVSQHSIPTFSLIIKVHRYVTINCCSHFDPASFYVMNTSSRCTISIVNNNIDSTPVIDVSRDVFQRHHPLGTTRETMCITDDRWHHKCRLK